MALFNLIARLSLDNSQFHAGLESSATAAERIGHRITHFFTKGFLALAGLHTLKTFINESDRMVDSWFEMNEQLKKFGKGMDEEVLRKLVEARIRMRELKVNTMPVRAEAQGFFGRTATAMDSAISFGAAFMGPIFGKILGMSDEQTKKRMEELIKESSVPFGSEGQQNIQDQVNAEMQRLRDEFDAKHQEKEDKATKEINRRNLEQPRAEDPLARIGGFSQFDARANREEEQVQELRKISKNTEGLNFNL